jgi:SAM-dependent methyltransferase
MEPRRYHASRIPFNLPESVKISVMTSQLRPPRGLNGLLSRAVKSFRIRQTLREIRDARAILDLGCGLCELTAKLDPNVNYTGVERDPWLYERAVRLFPRRHFLRADIEDLSFAPGGRYDAVLLVAVWEHLRRPLDFLDRVAEWTEPGGRLVMTTPSPAAHRILDAGAAVRLLSTHADEEHERLWSIAEIADAARQRGWRVIASRRFLAGLNQIIVLQK